MKPWTLALLATFLLATGSLFPPAAAQSDPLGGASKPRPQMTLGNRERQYKRIHQYALRLVLFLRFEEAEKFLRGHIEDHSEDPESHYLLGLLYSRLGESQRSVAMMEKAIALGHSAAEGWSVSRHCSEICLGRLPCWSQPRWNSWTKRTPRSKSLRASKQLAA